MIKVDTSAALKALRKDFSELDEKKTTQAMVWAINRTLGNAMTGIAKGIGKQYNIKSKEIKKAIEKRTAYMAKPWGLIIVTGKTLPIIAFKPKLTKKGIAFTIKKGNRVVLPGAFMVTTHSGHLGVFAKGKYAGKGGSFAFRRKRKGKAPMNTKKGILAYPDLNITEMQSISLPQAFANKLIQQTVQQELLTRYPQHLQTQLKRMLERMKGT